MDRDKIFQFLALILRDYIQQQQVSQAELAAQIGCSQSRLNDFLNKKGEIGSAKFDLILRLFPELQRPILSYLESRGGGVQQVANGNILSTITQTAGEAPRDPDGELLRRAADLATDLATEAGQVPLVPLLKGLRGLRDRK